MRHRIRTAERGYSLVEMLVVVAMIGIISLVTIPQFINYQRSAKLKTSMRQFVSDLRTARQRAVTKHMDTKVEFAAPSGSTAATYSIYEGNRTTNAWTQVGSAKRLETSTYFASTSNFVDRNANSIPDIVFRPDGTVVFDGTNTNGNVVISTDWSLPKSSYTVDVSFAGFVRVS